MTSSAISATVRRPSTSRKGRLISVRSAFNRRARSSSRFIQLSKAVVGSEHCARSSLTNPPRRGYSRRRKSGDVTNQSACRGCLRRPTTLRGAKPAPSTSTGADGPNDSRSSDHHVELFLVERGQLGDLDLERPHPELLGRKILDAPKVRLARRVEPPGMLVEVVVAVVYRQAVPGCQQAGDAALARAAGASQPQYVSKPIFGVGAHALTVRSTSIQGVRHYAERPSRCPRRGAPTGATSGRRKGSLVSVIMRHKRGRARRWRATLISIRVGPNTAKGGGNRLDPSLCFLRNRML